MRITIIALTIFLIPALLFAQGSGEAVTFTTYYPSPYGSYREMRAMRMAVGDNYVQRTNACWEETLGECGTFPRISADADLIVEGRVGIGTTSPGAELDIGSGALLISGQRSGELSSTQHGLLWHTSGPMVMYYGNSDFIFKSAGSDKVRITNAGNVGIGTASPAQKLDVVGTAQMTGFKMPTGASNNYVLTSNASGVGTWRVSSTTATICTWNNRTYSTGALCRSHECSNVPPGEQGCYGTAIVGRSLNWQCKADGSWSAPTCGNCGVTICGTDL